MLDSSVSLHAVLQATAIEKITYKSILTGIHTFNSGGLIKVSALY